MPSSPRTRNPFVRAITVRERELDRLLAEVKGRQAAHVQRDARIVGPDVPDQARLRAPQRVRDLDEFLRFLARLEAVFGPDERPRPVTTGDHFRL